MTLTRTNIPNSDTLRYKSALDKRKLRDYVQLIANSTTQKNDKPYMTIDIEREDYKYAYVEVVLR